MSGHPTPHLLKALNPSDIEAAVRIRNVWGGVIDIANELDAIEVDTASVSVKAAMHSAQAHLLDVLEHLRRALKVVGGG